MKMTIGVLQGPQHACDPAGNLARLEHAAREAAALGARLLVAPEMFLTGYNIGREAVQRLAEPADGAAARRISEIAGACDIAVLYGYPERSGPHIHNSAQLLDRNGTARANYRKTHLFGAVDRAMFIAGRHEPPVAELDGLRIGILICYDLEFPESARMLALAGADLIAVPTALMRPYEFVARTLVPARAYENQVFVAYANRCGTEREFEYAGLSAILAPDGTELARAGHGEALIVAALDLAQLAESRRMNPYLDDRRPGLYGALVRPHRTGKAR